ncbi:MAG: cation transporter [Acidobacteria bacterium]|nr:cation transporter [Acidobacteriota bacterium]MCI0720658.1 cation transporter [Acidobacteriota bacterium]
MNSKEHRRLGFMIGAVAFVLLGAYFVARRPQEKTRDVISKAPAKTIAIPIEGMTCASCVAQVRQKLKSIDGVSEVEVSLEHRRARVQCTEARVLQERLTAAINKLGYKAGIPTIEKAK